jgi:hypothetical protein
VTVQAIRTVACRAVLDGAYVCACCMHSCGALGGSRASSAAQLISQRTSTSWSAVAGSNGPSTSRELDVRPCHPCILRILPPDLCNLSLLPTAGLHAGLNLNNYNYFSHELLCRYSWARMCGWCACVPSAAQPRGWCVYASYCNGFCRFCESMAFGAMTFYAYWEVTVRMYEHRAPLSDDELRFLTNLRQRYA